MFEFSLSMDSSRRAVESYWTSRLIDAVTSDEDKVAPVYKLEEVCELLRSSSATVAKEVSEFILKRLDHKSSIVKQKALRLIKYSVGKSGVEFKREMQRHSAAIRQLFHYKGPLDPLKGDALNKAVRDTAHEAITSIFAADDNKSSHLEDINKRIQGFGNTSSQISNEGKKSFLSEIVDLGSASIRQGLNTITASQSVRINHRSSILRRSLTKEAEKSYTNEREEHPRENGGGFSDDHLKAAVGGGTLGQDSTPTMAEVTNGESGTIYTGRKSPEERLLETIVTSGSVRLQPDRDALQIFLAEATKMDALVLSHAIESRLQSHAWQMRMKTLCVLEAMLRKKDDAQFYIVESYFSKNRDAISSCLETPQVSLRERAHKVMNLLNGHTLRNSVLKANKAAPCEMLDLIDSGASGVDRTDISQKSKFPRDLLTLVPGAEDNANMCEDPFADVSFHTSTERTRDMEDVFSGLILDDTTHGDVEKSTPCISTQGSELFDTFCLKSEPSLQNCKSSEVDNMTSLMTGFSQNVPLDPQSKQLGGCSGGTSLGTNLLATHSNHQPLIAAEQNHNLDLSVPDAASSLGVITPQSYMFGPVSASQPVGSSYGQTHLLAMYDIHSLGNLNSSGYGVGLVSDKALGRLHPSPKPDVFSHASGVKNISSGSSTKEDEMRAFDFISEHLAAVRNLK